MTKHEHHSTIGNRATYLVLFLWAASTSMIFWWTDLLANNGMVDWQTTQTFSMLNVSATTVKSYIANGLDRPNITYQPSSSETYVLEHAEELGLLAASRTRLTVPSCKIFMDPEIPVYGYLQQYRMELAEYNKKSEAFIPSFTDLRTPLREDAVNQQAVCDSLDLNLTGIFKSKQLSYGLFGYAEPLIPPLRHPDFCFDPALKLSLNYLVHDWKTLCLRLTPYSRTVFIDMGASLSFHDNIGGQTPAVYILNTFKKFGFPFDHIYAYEVTTQEPAQVFRMIPDDLIHSYHWINVGVEAEPNGKMNPLRMILEKFNATDFIVIKLDIDTGSIEVPLAYQLLQDDRLKELVDVFYFEHHVHQQELRFDWRQTMQGCIKDSLELFQGLRKKGIASHYWV